MNEEALAHRGAATPPKKSSHTRQKSKKFRLIPNNHQALSHQELSMKLVVVKIVLTSVEEWLGINRNMSND